MTGTRVTAPIVAAIGIVLCLILAGCLAYFMIKPTQEAIGAAQSRYDAAAPDAAPAAKTKAEKDLQAAKVQVGQIKAQQAVLNARYQPPLDASNRWLEWRQLTNELTANLAPKLEKWIPSTGVTPLSTIGLPPPPASPNDPMVSVNPIVLNLGTVTVGGDFHKILKHVLLWDKFNRLILLDNVSLHGNSPLMTSAYTASVVLFPQNTDKPGKPVEKAGTGTGGAGGFGGGGFGGGGFGPPPGVAGGFGPYGGGPPPGVGGPGRGKGGAAGAD